MKTQALKAGDGKAFWVVGDLYTILASGEDTAGAYALIHAVVPAGAGPPPHLHRREDEAFYVLAGEVEVHVDGQTVRATAGDWITLPRGSLHYFKNVATTPAKMLILVTPSGLEKYFEEAGKPATDRTAPAPPPDIERLLAVAPKYGLEIRVPH